MTDVVMDTVSYMERIEKRSREAMNAAYGLVDDEDSTLVTDEDNSIICWPEGENCQCPACRSS